MSQDLTGKNFDFQSEALAAFENFPELKKSTFLSSFSKNTGASEIYVAEDQQLKEQHPEIFEEVATGYREAVDVMVKGRNSAGYGSAATKYHAKDKHVIQGLYLDLQSGDIMYGPDPVKGLAFTMDHEIGHLIVPGGSSFDSDKNVQFREACADAFGAIRAFQRYGNTAETREMLEALSITRTSNLFNKDDNEHYTSPTFDKILQDSAEVDFSKVSYREAIQIARKYAETCSPTQTQYNNAAPIFQLESATYVDYYRKKLDDTAKADIIEKLATTTLATSDKFSFSMGVRVFQPFMSGELNTLPEMTSKFAAQMADKARDLGLTAMADSLEGKKMEPTLPDNAPTASKFFGLEPKQSLATRFFDEIKSLKQELFSRGANKLALGVSEPVEQKKVQKVMRIG